MAEWLIAADLLAYAPDLEGSDEGALGDCCAAAAAYVERKRSDLDYSDKAKVPADVRLGSLMLAFRLWQRKRSPLGTIGSPTELGGSAQIVRYDPDIARLLGIGSEGPFAFGAGGWASTQATDGSTDGGTTA